MNCINCSKPLEAHTGVNTDDKKPAPGSLCICAYCGTLYRVNGADEMIPTTDEMEAEIERLSPEAMRIVRESRRYIHSRIKNT